MKIEIPQKNYQETPLCSAAENGHLIVYQFLVRNVDKNPKNWDGLSPLNYAATKKIPFFERFYVEYQEEARNDLKAIVKKMLLNKYSGNLNKERKNKIQKLIQKCSFNQKFKMSTA